MSSLHQFIDFTKKPLLDYLWKMHCWQTKMSNNRWFYPGVLQQRGDISPFYLPIFRAGLPSVRIVVISGCSRVWLYIGVFDDPWVLRAREHSSQQSWAYLNAWPSLMAHCCLSTYRHEDDKTWRITSTPIPLWQCGPWTTLGSRSKSVWNSRLNQSKSI